MPGLTEISRYSTSGHMRLRHRECDVLSDLASDLWNFSSTFRHKLRSVELKQGPASVTTTRGILIN